MKKTRLFAQMLLVAVLCACMTGNAFAARLGEAPLHEGSNSRIAPKALQVIPIRHNLTRSQVIAMADSLPNTAFKGGTANTHEAQPVLYPPYEAGKLSAQSEQDALNALKMVRYLAGVPYADVSFGEQENLMSQHGATLLAATGQFTHTPARPSGMDDDFFELAYAGCSKANLASGYTNASTAIVHGFIGDKGATNIKAVGHRRWTLMPSGSVYGVGQADTRTSLYVMSNSPATGVASDYVAWPNSGDFPLQYFVGEAASVNAPEFPWSINLGSPYGVASKSKLKITMTRSYDNHIWTFDASTPSLATSGGNGKHLDVDNQSMGMNNVITFRPDLATLGKIRNGDAFDISVTGLGGPDIRYTVRFFDLNRPAGYVEASSLSFAQSSAKLKAGQKLTLGSTLLPANSTSRQLVWSSSNASVASVTQTGQILAKNKGDATIFAMAADNTSVFAKCTVTVTGKAVALKKIATDKTMIVNNGAAKKIKLKFTPAGATNKEVVYKTSNEQIATVDEDGMVTGRRVGKATITITSEEGGKTASCEVTVAAPVTAITTAQSTIYLKKGGLGLLAASATTVDGSAAKLTFTSSAKKIVAVDGSGILRALKKGKANITIQAENGVKKKVKLVVGGSLIQSLSIGGLPPSNTLTKGNIIQLKPVFSPAKAQGAAYFDSSQPGVISIDASGRATALSRGLCTVTLTMGEKTASVTLNVVE